MKNNPPMSTQLFGITLHFGSSSWKTLFTARRMSESEKL